MESKKGEKENNMSVSNNPDNMDTISDEMKSEESRKKQNKQLIWATVLMISVIAIILIVPYLMNNYFNKFDYNGIEFTKTKFGKLDVYVGELPIFNSDSGNAITGKSIASIYSLYLRNDPRKLDNVDVLLDVNNITFIKKKTVYVSYNSSAPPCNYNVVAAAELGKFLINFGGLDVEGAFINKDYAEQSKTPYVTCENHPDNTVVLVVSGQENKISKIKINCYEVQYKDCDILDVTEEFIISVSEGYINYTYSNGNK